MGPFDYKSKINFTLKDGGTTHAATASMALLHWLFCQLPDEFPENPEPWVLYQVGQPIHGPYEHLFLVNVLAALERNHGSGPNLPEELLSEDWYEWFSDETDHNFVLQALEDGNKLVEFYENTCLDILRWLEGKGELKLEVCNG